MTGWIRVSLATFCDQKRPKEPLVEIACLHASGHTLVSSYGLGGAWNIGQQCWSGAAIYNFLVGSSEMPASVINVL